ncbi:undecaprenyl-diphosphate phosphatase [Gammaproteobacteria bacterium]|nr:undecaprenyl-diphosphate phosphatase [Gammaproteobacteria bacterium]
MNDIFLSIALALIQGLTEFLPVSSSAHLLFPSLLFGANDLGLSFDIATHGGTLFAVLVYFRLDIKKMFLSINPFFNNHDIQSRQLFTYLIVATFPIIVFGLIGSDYIANRSFGVTNIAWANLIFATVLFLAYRYSSQSKTILQLSIFTVLFIGLFQVFALIPGASRSGTAMTAALIIGLNLKEASRFAFLLSIPTILGALIFLLIDSFNSFEAINLSSLFIGFSISAIFAFFTIKFFLAFIDKIGMYPFVLYRLVLGLGLLLTV